MTTIPAVAAVIDPDETARPERHLSVAIVFSCFWIGALTFCAVFASALPFVKSPKKITPRLHRGPSLSNWFGTDRLGRDIFTRSIYGARTSLMIAGLSISIGLVIGGTIGLLAGYYRRKFDYVTSLAVDVLLAFPPLILALAIVSVRDTRGVTEVVFALSILSIAPLIRVVRAQTLVYAQREFVLAAKGLGARNGRILFREVLPNVVPSMLTFALTGLAILVVAEGGLAFLGLSVGPPRPTWGGMISEGYQDLERYPWMALFPCLMLFLTVLSFNLLGDQVSKRFDIKESLA